MRLATRASSGGRSGTRGLTAELGPFTNRHAPAIHAILGGARLTFGGLKDGPGILHAPSHRRTKQRRSCILLAVEHERNTEFDSSERRIGITKEAWFIQQTPRGDLLIAYIESPDFERALGLFSQSTEAFDVWFKEQLASVTGVDLNNPPPGPLSELLSSYQTGSVAATV